MVSREDLLGSIIKQYKECMTLDIKVKPANRQNEIFISAAGMLVVSLQAVAEDGRANKMLIKYLAKLLRIPQKRIVIQRGALSRLKLVLIIATPDEQHRLVEFIIHYLLRLSK